MHRPVVIAALTLCVACARGGAGDAEAATESALQPNAADGYRLTLTGTVGGNGTVPAWAAKMLSVTADVRVRQGRGRVEFGRLAPPGLPAGTYLLLNATTGETMVVVPEQRTVMRSGSAVIRPSSMPASIEVVDTTYTMQDLGAGETVLGLPTRKYRVAFGYSMRARGAVNPPTWRNEFVTTLHVSERVAALDPVLAQFTTLTSDAIGLGAGTTASPAVTALAQRQPAGFVLLREQDAISITGRDTTHSRNTWRVTALQRGGVQAADLEVPAGFTVRVPGQPITTQF